ncbi:UNVERIFIED_CONTAM: hypothetical protein HDU68_011435 [Siphonaria sp. JEL0065]|nr:hypothetical protein HDU68_011435 [Siphonaria sp. JEL0065]
MVSIFEVIVPIGVLVLVVGLAYIAIVPSNTANLGSLSDNPQAKEGLQKYYTHSNEHSASLSLGKTYYRLLGPEDGKRILLVHGISGANMPISLEAQVNLFRIGTWSTAPHVVDSLVEKGLRVLAFDIYGRGRSDSPGVQYNFETYTNQIQELMKHVGWDVATLVGYSMGGAIAIAFADNYPQGVERLVVIAPGGIQQQASPLLAIFHVPIFGSLLYYALGRWYIVREIRKSIQPFPDGSRMGWNGHGEIVSVLYNPGFLRAYRSTFMNNVIAGNEDTFKSVGQRFNHKVLCIWGSKDTGCDYATDGKVFQACMPEARFVTVEGGDHDVVIIDWKSVLEPLCLFLEESGE